MSGHIWNRSSKTVWVVETDTGPAVAHKLKSGWRSPRNVDSDGVKAVDGTPISRHRSWWKFRGTLEVEVHDDGLDLKILRCVYPDCDSVDDDEFGNVRYDHASGWGEPFPPAMTSDVRTLANAVARELPISQLSAFLDQYEAAANSDGCGNGCGGACCGAGCKSATGNAVDTIGHTELSAGTLDSIAHHRMAELRSALSELVLDHSSIGVRDVAVDHGCEDAPGREDGVSMHGVKDDCGGPSKGDDSVESAIENACTFIREEWEERTRSGETIPQPHAFLIDTDLSTNGVVESVEGPVSPPTNDTFLRCVFADDNPNANWEHPCRYVFANETGLSVVESTVPPSQRSNQVALDITDRIFPSA